MFVVSLNAPPGGSGAAEILKPRQVREEAAVRGPFRVPPVTCPGALYAT